MVKSAAKKGSGFPKIRDVYTKKEDIQVLFLALLERKAQENETALFTENKVSLREAIRTILDSEEYKEHKLRKEQELAEAEKEREKLGQLAADSLVKDTDVRTVYQLFLKREAQEKEIHDWTEKKIPLRDFLTAILQSEEYDRLLDRQRRDAEENAGRIRKLDCTKEDVETLFSEVLRRTPSDQEVELYVGNRSEIRDLLRSVFNSEEYKSLKAADEECADQADIKMLYQAVLGRQASESEIRMYLSRHASRRNVLQSLAESGELKERLKTLNRNEVLRRYDLNMELKSDLMDLLLGRPMRNYETGIFGEQKIGEFVEAVLSSDERKSYEKIYISNNVIEDKYGAATYSVMWKKPAIFTCIYNGMFKDTITTEMRKNSSGIWKEQYQFLKYFPEEGTFIDIGANIGVMSCLYCSKGWSGYAIEASERNVQCIKKAKDLNNLKLEIGEFAVSDQTSVLRFLENGPWGAVENEISDCTDEIQDRAFENIVCKEVQAYALDDWDKTNLSVPEDVSFIKMDIEGSEITALYGMKKFLKKYNYPVIYCESNGESLFHFGYTTEDLRSVFQDIGYSRYRWLDESMILCNETAFQPDYCTDYLFIHDMPDFLSGFITVKEKQEVQPADIVKLLKSSLFGEKVHACSELKNFREFLKNQEITDILKEYQNGGNKVLREALAWFQP